MITNLDSAKCVLIVDSKLSVGEQTNAAAVLAMTIGHKMAQESSATLQYIRLGLIEKKKSTNKLTGNLKLLRR